MNIKPTIHTAVLGKTNVYGHFGISELTASLYGDKVEDIVSVEVTVANNQEKPPAPQDDPNINEADYWAWWDNEREKFTLIWPKYFLLNMCFTYGMKPEEERGRGKAYRVNVKPVKLAVQKK